MDIWFKMDIVMAEQEYGKLGFARQWLWASKTNFDLVEKFYFVKEKGREKSFKIEFSEHWQYAW